jgi:hypothetical protein
VGAPCLGSKYVLLAGDWAMDFTWPDHEKGDGSKKRPPLIQEGDLVIIMESHDSLYHSYVTKGKVVSNQFGTFHHDDLIGTPFGRKVSQPRGESHP